MELIKTNIEGVLIIKPRLFEDNRGWFMETYADQKLKEKGINIKFVQDNHSLSLQKDTLRGLHFQVNPKAQTKLVRCTRGSILDVAVDLRKGSPTFKKWVSVELSAENKKQLLIPKGFAHGFLTLTDDAEVQYKVDEYYNPECDRTLKFNDPDLGINWQIENPILSEKDLTAPLLKDSDVNFQIKILVTGSNGQLGYDVIQDLSQIGVKIIATTKNDFDITNPTQTKQCISDINPDIIIHCAAYTAVDQAEEEKDICYSVNVEGTKNIAQIAQEINAKLVYISTDYVFDGSGNNPHLITDSINPLNHYGYTKAQGEEVIRNLIQRHFIIRTSWVYGINGNNFVKTMIRLAKSKKTIQVVNDQIGSPTYTKDLARFISKLIQTDNYGTYHGVNEGYCSWWQFAQEIFAQLSTNIEVIPISSQDYITKAQRPLNSRLSTVNIENIGLQKLPHWKNALTRYLQEIQ
ncbi:dTDP-4-dehydrorhamnose reductase [Cyanobacterium stanieri PCC 7202]|uniref:dTDP-4-dehydrorhamnose reductase n=1 Tax=Cyanobacterium stanieri (strain ATCC 29140 / PCC 7202) TaxID=292563 RepID=K9YM63_CYASC|nr:dTDP-4-dehydrorhamnose reductase [Cyanobacterium stanieri PCC 7202]